MTLAVKVVLNTNATNQPNKMMYMDFDFVWICFQFQHIPREIDVQWSNKYQCVWTVVGRAWTQKYKTIFNGRLIVAVDHVGGWVQYYSKCLYFA